MDHHHRRRGIAQLGDRQKHAVWVTRNQHRIAASDDIIFWENGTSPHAREHVRAMRWIRPSPEQVEIVGRVPAATERLVAILRG
jgi:hypothetical protein